MIKNGLIAMVVMIAAVAVSGGLIMSQQNVKYNHDMTGMERLLYDESYKAWLENFDVSSFDIRKVKNADSMFQLQKKIKSNVLCRQKFCRYFFRKNLSAGKKSSIIKIEKILRKGDFVDGKIVGGRIGRTKRKRTR